MTLLTIDYREFDNGIQLRVLVIVISSIFGLMIYCGVMVFCYKTRFRLVRDFLQYLRTPTIPEQIGENNVYKYKQ